MKKIILIFLLALTTNLFSQGLIINEVSQGESGTKEYIEMVVVGSPCTTVDLRGWIIDDNNGVFSGGPASSVGIATGYIKFSTNSLWSAVNVGTMILIYNDSDICASISTLIDINPIDFSLTIPIKTKKTTFDSTYFIGNDSFPNTTSSKYNLKRTFPNWINQLSLANGCDGTQIRKPDTSFYHGIAFGVCSSTHPDLSTYTPNHLIFKPLSPTSGADRNYYITNAISYDYKDKRNWTTDTLVASRTPGSANNSANLAWLNYLRSCVLPIELISFIGNQNDGINELSWITASEFNNDYFSIERSYPNTGWEGIAKVKGKNKTNLSSYLYYDSTYNDNVSIVYYRLKQVDFDGTITYSNIISITNPILNNYKIESVKFFDVLGQEVKGPLTNSTYIAEIKYTNKRIDIKRIQYVTK